MHPRETRRTTDIYNTDDVFVLEIGVYLQNSLQLQTGIQTVLCCQADDFNQCMGYTGGVNVGCSGGGWLQMFSIWWKPVCECSEDSNATGRTHMNRDRGETCRWQKGIEGF